MSCSTCRPIVERACAIGAALAVPCPDCGCFGDQRDQHHDITDCSCVFPQRAAVQHQWACPVRQRFERARFFDQVLVDSPEVESAIRTLVSCKHPASERVWLGRHRDGVREILFCDACGAVFLGDDELVGSAVATLREQAGLDRVALPH